MPYFDYYYTTFKRFANRSETKLIQGIEDAYSMGEIYYVNPLKLCINIIYCGC